MRSASARPMGLIARRNRVPPPKINVIANRPSISIPWVLPADPTLPLLPMFQGATPAAPGLHQLDRFDRAERDGDLGVVAAGRPEIDLVGSHVGVDARRNADDLGPVRRRD